MQYHFYTYKDEVEGHTFWVAKSAVLKGCVGQGDTLDDAISELAVNENDWLEEAEEFGIAIPVTELEERLQRIPGSYQSFVSAVLDFAKKKESRYEVVCKFLNTHSDASSSDVLDFISSHDDFCEDAIPCFEEDI